MSVIRVFRTLSLAAALLASATIASAATLRGVVTDVTGAAVTSAKLILRDVATGQEQSGQTNDKGQYVFYGKVGGCIVTGNEDGIKHVGMGVLYSLQHVGYTIPPQADAGWVGEAGPGQSYGDAREDGEGYVGFDNDFTRRNTTFMTWNLMHMARMLKDAVGIPAHGNSVDLWNDGRRFDAPNPEYR